MGLWVLRGGLVIKGGEGEGGCTLMVTYISEGLGEGRERIENVERVHDFL